MGFLDVIQRKLGVKSKVGYEFTDEDRDKATVSKKQKAIEKDLLDLHREEIQHLKKMKQQRMIQEEIEELRRELYGNPQESNEDMDPDEMFFNQILQPIMQQRMGAVQPSTDPQSTVTLTDEDIDGFLNNIPKPVYSALKKTEPETASKFLSAHMPGLDEESHQRILTRI